LSWWSHSAQNCSRTIECRKIKGLLDVLLVYKCVTQLL
jgi:hypothetical protein